MQNGWKNYRTKVYIKFKIYYILGASTETSWQSIKSDVLVTRSTFALNRGSLKAESFNIIKFALFL